MNKGANIPDSDIFSLFIFFFFAKCISNASDYFLIFNGNGKLVVAKLSISMKNTLTGAVKMENQLQLERKIGKKFHVAEVYSRLAVTVNVVFLAAQVAAVNFPATIFDSINETVKSLQIFEIKIFHTKLLILFRKNSSIAFKISF